MHYKPTKEEFVKKNASLIKQEIGNLETTKFQWKRYQDEIISLLRWSTIQLPYNRQLSVNNTRNTLIDLLKESLVIDEELYQFLINKREYYLESKPWRGAAWIEYATWTKNIQSHIETDPDINLFSKKRVQDNIQINYKDQQESIVSMENNYKRIQTLLQKKKKRTNKNDKLFLVNELENITHELELEHYKLADLYDKAQSPEHEYQQTRLFTKKLKTLLSNYITSRNHADENLRKKYIELFLLDKIKDGVQFEKGEEYTLLFSQRAKNMLNDQKDQLLSMFNKYEDEKKYIQWTLDFWE